MSERLRKIKGDKEAADERAVLTTWLQLTSDEIDLKRRLKDADAALDAAAYAHYPQ